jgi:hypothetical protein
MIEITTRLRRLYVQDGTNYVQEAADTIDKLRAERDMWKDTVTQRDRQILGLVNDVHSCGPTCARAGCVNRRLRDALTHISLCSKNSMSSKDECGSIARAALEQTK